MTHTKISEAAGKRLEELTSMSRLSAVIDCLKFENGDEISTSKEVIEALLDSTNSSEYRYFSESAFAWIEDPIAEVEKQLIEGFISAQAHFDLNKPPNWGELPNQIRNVRYKGHAWLMMDSLLVADGLVGDNKYLQKAVDIADDWIRQFIVSANPDEFAWYDMAVGQRSTKLAYMLRRIIEEEFPVEQIFRFILASEIHSIELMQVDRVATHSNHGLFQMAGLLSLSRTLPWSNLSGQSFEFVEKTLTSMLSSQFSAEGLHLEHSPDYHLYMVNHLKSFIDSGWLKDSKELNSMIGKVEAAAHWMQTPRNNMIAVGDTNNNTKIGERWNGGNKKLELGLKVFNKGGFVIENVSQKNSFSQLVFTAQFHSRQHKHADDLSIVYSLNNLPFLVDAGRFTYQYDLPERIYCESTRAHNTVEIDGLNHSRYRQDAYGSALSFSITLGPCSVSRGEVHHRRTISAFIPNNKIGKTDGIQTDVKHQRTIIHFPNRFLAVIDQLQSPEPHDYIQWNHFAPHLQVRKYTEEKHGIHNSMEETISIMLNSSNDENPLNSQTVRGQTQPHLQGWQAHQGAELIENTAVGFSTFGTDKIFVTVFDFKMKNTGSPYIRNGSSGKYQRFALTQDGLKTDIKFRENSDGQITIDAIIDGNEFSEAVTKMNDS